MKLKYGIMLLALLAGVFLAPAPQARAQSPLVVEWETSPGSDIPIVNALRDAIANDTNRPADRVYVLKRGGFYWITDRISNADFPLRLVGETEAAVPPGQTDFGPAIIQRVARSGGGGPDGTMFESFHDLTVRNVWIMGQTDQGVLATYEPIKLLGDGKRYVFDNVVFDRNDWHHLGPDGPNNDFVITNCKFRNIFGPTQIWEGLGIRFEVGADTVVIENNTFFNIGFTPFQSEAVPVNYLRFNHNTLVNVGRSFQAGAIWKECYVVNNLFVNYFWHGESEAQYTDPNRIDAPGFFGIGALPARFGTNYDRQIVLANNGYWRDPRFDTFDANQVPPILPQPFISDTTQGWFDAWENMVIQNNFNTNPGLTTYLTDDIFPQMTQHIADLYANPQVIPAARYFWDPGRDEQSFVNSIWPLPENFTYSNTQLQTAGTDGLPLGDLNWYPNAKTTFEANKAAYVKAIEDLVSAPKLDILLTEEAEKVTVGTGATVNVVQGFTYYQMDGGGFIQWKFDVPTAGTAELVVHTHLRGNSDRGQRIIINGKPTLRNNNNYGEYFWSGSLGDPTNQWFDSRITQAGCIAGTGVALDLPAGQNTIRIEPSWGYQNFSKITVLVGGNTIELTAPDAEVEGVIPHAEDPVGVPVAWAPSGFKSVALAAGGSISLSVNAPYNGQYMMRLFYAASGTVQGQVAVDGQVVVPSVPFADTSDVFTDQFAMTSGNHTITLSSASGGVAIDYLQVIAFVPTGVAGRDNLPEGFALHQNYPNPFNPTTNIAFSLGKPSKVKLSIYNVLGQRVLTLLDSPMAEGAHTVQFDAKKLSSGVYFYRLEAGDFLSQRRMLLIK
ncbi:T9SS type A sorting domain-containing protein [bacterium]|nr:T9SS type A sorting domain-containing protein [bacterium]